MSELVLERVWSRTLKNVSLRSGRGLSVIVGADSDGADDLVEVCAGVRAPRRGQLTLDGVRPSASPACRRRIASLLPDEPPGAFDDVRGWLAKLATLIGFELPAVLAGSRIEPERPLSTLNAAERRELALAIALVHPNPSLVVLHEPLGAAISSRHERLLARLAELASIAPVVIVTASIADARRIGGTTYLLDRGLLDEKAGGAWPSSLTPGLGACLAIEADAPRGLVAALAEHPDVSELSYDERHGGRVFVRGADLERLAVAVARAATGAGVDIRLLRVQVDDLSAARAAAAGTNEAAAYRAARSRARPAAPTVRASSAEAAATPASKPPERAP